MELVAATLRPLRHKVVVPLPINDLSSSKVLVMDFIEGTPMSELREKMRHVSEAQRRIGGRMILGSLAQAYGHMLFAGGPLHADCHPGNILVLPGAKIALLDYGQIKHMTDAEVAGFARLITLVGEDKGDAEVSGRPWKVSSYWLWSDLI